METDEFSAAASLNHNFQDFEELEKACPEWQLRQYVQNGLNIINPDTSPKSQVALFVWKKQEAKSLIAVGKVTANPELRIVIWQLSKHLQMDASTVGCDD